MKSLFDSLFGNSWLGFSDDLFTCKDGKSIGFMGNKSEQSEDKYTFRFPLGKDIDTNLLKVNVDTKEGKLIVKYDDDKEHSSVHYEFVRTLPGDALLKTAFAETTGSELTITFDRDVIGVEPVKGLEIPIKFSDDKADE